MMIPGETVQVELINAWWEQLLPIAALLISLFSVGLTLVYRYFDRLKLTIAVEWVETPVTGLNMFTGRDRVVVTVTNESRTATTEVSTVLLRSDQKRSFPRSAQRHPLDDSLPVILQPGQSASQSFLAAEVGALLNGAASGAKSVFGEAITGHRTVRGKRLRKLAGTLRQYGEDHPLVAH